MANINIKSLWVFLAIFAIIFVYYIGFRRGKNMPPKEVKDVSKDLNAGGGATKTIDSQQASLQRLTDRAWDDIEGVNVLGHDGDLWSEINMLSDSELVYVINDWDSRYFAKHKETLARAMSKEFSYGVFKRVQERVEKLSKNR